jgi:hypothetical protein
VIVKAETIDGKKIEVHDDRFGRRRYWAKIDGRGLFQRGRMRVRTFATADAAYKAAIDEVQS